MIISDFKEEDFNLNEVVDVIVINEESSASRTTIKDILYKFSLHVFKDEGIAEDMVDQFLRDKL